MRYRPHRGSLADSLAATVEIEPTLAAVASKIGREPQDIHIRFYGDDPRCKWTNYIVTTKDNVHGFIDQDITEP